MTRRPWTRSTKRSSPSRRWVDLGVTLRFFIVGRTEAGRPLGACLCDRLSLSRSLVRRLLASQQVRVNGKLCSDLQQRLLRGQRIQVRLPKTRPKHEKPTRPPLPSGPRPVLRYVDASIVVVDKPAGLTTMRHAEDIAEFGQRAKRYLPPTLADLLPGMLKRRSDSEQATVRAVHRLDKDTSGLVVFARTVRAERHLSQQFRAHTIGRRYLALVRGRARDARIESWLVRDRGDGRRGSSPAPGEGQRAVTHVRKIEELGDYTLVECQLETGRTHQIRIHLGEGGTPLCGERIYDRPLHGKPLPDGSGLNRVALHATYLALQHPSTGESLHWSSRLPKDMADFIKRHRGS